jgi:Zn ribbon nucleic-acid-binding protein
VKFKKYFLFFLPCDHIAKMHMWDGWAAELGRNICVQCTYIHMHIHVNVNLRVHVHDHIHIHINIQRIQESRTQSKDRLQTQLEKLRADWCVCARVCACVCSLPSLPLSFASVVEQCVQCTHTHTHTHTSARRSYTSRWWWRGNGSRTSCWLIATGSPWPESTRWGLRGISGGEEGEEEGGGGGGDASKNKE